MMGDKYSAYHREPWWNHPQVTDAHGACDVGQTWQQGFASMEHAWITFSTLDCGSISL